MKKFLVILVIAVAVVSLGLTIYYFSADNEVIYINNSYVVINKYDSFGNLNTLKVSDVLEVRNGSEHTTIDFDGVKDESIVEYDADNNLYRAQNAGDTEINIKTNNRRYSNIVIKITVNDGSEQYPFIIRTEAELRAIGDSSIEGNKFTTDDCYILGNDINLIQEWTPIIDYTGIFDGDNYIINNMSIGDAPVQQTEQVNSADPVDSGDVAFIQSLTQNDCTSEEARASRNGQFGSVRNLKFSNVKIAGTYSVVAVIVANNGGTVKSCEVISGQISSDTDSAVIAGIVGKNIDNIQNRALVTQCATDKNFVINITNASQMVAGIVAENNGGQVIECAYRSKATGVANSEFSGIVASNVATGNNAADIKDSYAYFYGASGSVSSSTTYGVAKTNTDTATLTNGLENLHYGGTVSGITDIDVLGVTVIGQEKLGYLSIEDFKLQQSFTNWNFDTVWYMGEDYPELNFAKESGSTNVGDIDTDITNSGISALGTLYDTLNAHQTDNSEIKVSIANLESENGVFYWYPINTFNGKLVFENTVIPELVIISDNTYNNDSLVSNEDKKLNIGMFRNLDANAEIYGLSIKKVTFAKLEDTTINYSNIDDYQGQRLALVEGDKANYCGVLAGVSEGANVSKITIKNVTINLDGNGSLSAVGGVFGKAKAYTGHGITEVYIDGITSTANTLFDYAGGVVGFNYTTIASSDATKDRVYNVRLIGRQVGGVAGYNQGTIKSIAVNSMNYKQWFTADNLADLFAGVDFYLGGITGRNISGYIEQCNVTGTYLGVETGSTYECYLGGISGLSSGTILLCYVNSTTLDTVDCIPKNLNRNSNHTTVIGGVVGDNANGFVNKCFVDDGTKIKASTTFVTTPVEGQAIVIGALHYSTVGGLVGYNRTSTCISVYQSGTEATIQGFYAGGLIGLNYGYVDKCFKEGGAITGFNAGGLASLVAGGFIRNCYAICKLIGANYAGTDADWRNYTDNTATYLVAMQKTSAKAGLAVFVVYPDTYIQTSYAAVTFGGYGGNFGTTASQVHRADRAKYNYGSIYNCIYQTAGSHNFGGVRLSESEMKGTSGQYRKFIDTQFDTRYVWDITTNGGGYPTLMRLKPMLPSLDA